MKNLFLLLLFFTPALAWSQHIHGIGCGTSVEDGALIKERLFANRADDYQHASSRNAVEYVPVRFNIVGTDNGGGYVSELRAFEAICLLNEYYEDLGLTFYFKEFTYINNSTLYNNAKCSSCELFLSSYMQDKYDAMNIFLLKNSGTIPSGGNSAGFYAPSTPNINRDYIVINNSSLLQVSVTPHEIGHFFSLSHPFFGWEPAPYNDINPQPAPNQSPSGFTPTERANGTNCNFAADGFCDTPPDYLNALSPNYSNNCSDYDGGALDPLGVEIDPQEENLMSYFNSCSNYILTPEQQEAVLDDVGSPGRFYLKLGNPAPTSGEITETATLQSPPNDADLDLYNGITLSWDAVPEATEYIVEVDVSPVFSTPNLQRFYVTGTSVTLDWIEDAPTYWRVMAFNPTNTCEPFSDPFFFRTGLVSSSVDIQELNSWNIFPNPIPSGQSLTLNVDASETFQAVVEVIDLTGRVVYRQAAQSFPAGGATRSIPTGNLQPGLYTLKLQSQDGLSSKRFVVQ